MKKVIALVLMVAMVFTLSACGGGSDKNAVTEDGYKSEIIIAMADEFTEPDPMETTAETNQIVQDCTHDLLTDTVLETMTNEGELVDTWEMKDLTHWYFKLKEGVKFHDGTILDVDDVEFTLMERAPQHTATQAYAAKIAKFTKLSDLEFEVELAQGDVDFNYTFAANSLAILSKEAFETMDEADAVKIGTGPWMYDEIVPGDYVRLKRFDECTLYDVPHTEYLTFKMIPEASARMIALENGEVDVIMTPAATDYQRLIDDENLDLVTEVGRTQNIVAFNLMNEDSIVSDRDFRLAVAYGIDKDEMVQAAWDGYAQVSTNWHCRDSEFYTEIEGIPYDPVKAQELFDKCGATGMTIKCVTSDADHRQKMATNLQAQMAKYGITVEIETMQNSALTELNCSDGATNGVEMTITSWTPGKNADYMYRNPMHSTGGRNYSHTNDPVLDQMIDEAAAEMDPVKRQEEYTAIQNKVVTEIINTVPIAQPTLTLGIRAGVTGCLLHPGLVHQFKKAELFVGTEE